MYVLSSTAVLNSIAMSTNDLTTLRLRSKRAEVSSQRIELPSIDDCLQCCKTVAKPTRCIVCSQAYHPSCAAQCGFLESGAVKKCCDAPLHADSSFFSGVLNGANVGLSELSDDCSSGDSDDAGSCDTVKNANPLKSSGLVSKKYLKEALNIFAKEITESISVSINSLTSSLENRLIDMQSSINSISAIASQNKADIDLLKSTVTSNESRLDVHEQLTGSLGLKVSKCGENIAKLRQELSDLKSANEANLPAAVSVAVSEASKCSIEVNFSEFCDRLRRSKNLVFFKIPENNGNDQSLSDKTVILDLLHKTKAFDHNSVSVKCLGQYKAGTSRPILVTLPAREDVMMVL